MRASLALAGVAVLAAAAAPSATGAGSAGRAKKAGAKAKPSGTAMVITSATFRHNTPIPKKHSCEGDDVSPALSWSEVPAGTKSLALIMDDPDAPPGTWVHWVIYDMPPGLSGLPEGVPKTETLKDGSRQGSCWGVDSFPRVGYFGPCPPPGKPHRYCFKLYALSETLGLPAKTSKPEIEKAMKGKVLAQAEIIGIYQR